VKIGPSKSPIALTFKYLSELFEQLPTATTVEAVEALLPWNLKSSRDAQRNRWETAP